jgi:sugar/nucleoside kinase (ribokinase family)
MAACAAVELGSNTLCGERERRVSRLVRDSALAAGTPLIVDVNLRLHWWPSRDEAVEVVRSFCRGALLVKMNEEEARLLTGNDDAAAAAHEVCASLEVGTAVVTLGADGALMRGAASADVPACRAQVVDTTGAGDAVTGVLVAALAHSGFDPCAAAEALPLAVTVASRATESHGATEGLPWTMELGDRK